MANRREYATISYWCPIWTEPLSSTVFEIFGPKTRACAHTHIQTHAASDFICCPMQCFAYWTDNETRATSRYWMLCSRSVAVSQTAADFSQTWQVDLVLRRKLAWNCGLQSLSCRLTRRSICSAWSDFTSNDMRGSKYMYCCFLGWTLKYTYSLGIAER